MKCAECGKGPVETRRENYLYGACGLDNVTLVDIEVRHCKDCGQNEYVIPNIEGLHRVIAHLMATKQQRLMPREIRFLRKYLGYCGADFAKAIGVQPETVSRWENGSQEMMLGLERFLRLMVLFEKPIVYYPRERVNELGNKAAAASKLKLASKRKGWEVEEARAA